MAARFVALVVTLSLLASVAFGGTRYFFCAAMDRVLGSDPCCEGFEHAAGDDDGMSIGETEAACCEARQHAMLPGAVNGEPPASLESPWVGLVELPAAHTIGLGVRSARFSEPVRIDTGPPPDTARATCVKLSVFVI